MPGPGPVSGPGQGISLGARLFWGSGGHVTNTSLILMMFYVWFRVSFDTQYVLSLSLILMMFYVWFRVSFLYSACYMYCIKISFDT